MGSYLVHFYSKIRAKDAMNFIQEQPNQFSNADLVIHRKEIGTLGLIGEESKEAVKKKGKRTTDDDGWTT